MGTSNTGEHRYRTLSLGLMGEPIINRLGDR